MLRFTITFVVALVIAMAGAARADLLAHYDFMGDAQDDSGNNRHGTLEGGVGFTTDPDRAQVLNLDGSDDRVDVTASLFDMGSDFTAAIWAKVPARTTCTPLVSKPEGWGSHTVFQIVGNPKWGGTGPENHLSLGGNGRQAYTAGDSGAQYDDDQWHQYVITYDYSAEETHIYLDGSELPNSNGRECYQRSTSGDAHLGYGYNVNGNGPYYMAGLMSDVHLYDEVLDGNAVGALWQATQPGGPVIPEPSTFVIWGLGLLGLVLCGRRRRRAA